MSMYGNITNYFPRTKFQFYGIFPSRDDMMKVAEDKTKYDNLTNKQVSESEKYDKNLINSYLLVDYTHGGGKYSDNHKKDITRFGTDENHSANFDLTVWQVRLDAGYPKCFAIARLHSVLPTFEIQGSYQFDLLPPISEGDYFGKGKNDNV